VKKKMERRKRSQGTGEGVEALTLTGGGTLIEVSGKPAKTAALMNLMNDTSTEFSADRVPNYGPLIMGEAGPLLHGASSLPGFLSLSWFSMPFLFFSLMFIFRVHHLSHG
jgi:hypothetical protein